MTTNRHGELPVQVLSELVERRRTSSRSDKARGSLELGREPQQGVGECQAAHQGEHTVEVV